MKRRLFSIFLPFTVLLWGQSILLNVVDSCYLYFYVLPALSLSGALSCSLMLSLMSKYWVDSSKIQGHHNYCLCSRRRGFVGPLALYTQLSPELMVHWVLSYLSAPLSCLRWNPHLFARLSQVISVNVSVWCKGLKITGLYSICTFCIKDQNIK